MSSIHCAAIIAGGASRRMKTNKALLQMNGESLVARAAGVLRLQFERVIVVTSDETIAREANLPAIPDEFPNRGPLGGIHAALRYFDAPTFCVACDMPFLNAAAIEFLCEKLEDYGAVLPRLGSGENARAEPLHAVYAPSCLPIIEREFASARARSVERTLQNARVRFVEENELRGFDTELRFLRNWNFPQDAQADGCEVS